MRFSSDAGQQTYKLYLIAGAISLILSFWMSINQVIINPDAICYLLSANEIGQSGIRSAMQLCPQSSWPFYSLLIFTLSKFSWLSLLASAYFLDALFTLMSVICFIAIVHALGGTRRTLWLAALVILSAHQFNAVRQYIVRDHGFWAFYLLSLFFMLRFLRDGGLKNTLGFGLSLMIAALFRIEGVVFLLLLPFTGLLQSGNIGARLKAYFMLNGAAVAAVMAGGAWLILHPQQSIDQLGRLPELWHQLWNGLAIAADRFVATKVVLAQQVLPHEAVRDAGIVWALTLAVLYVFNIINNLSWVAAALVVYAWVSGAAARLPRYGKLALAGYLAANLIISAVFFAERLFFSKRYLIAMTLVLLLWVPFALERLLSHRPRSWQRYAAYFAMLLLFVSSVGAVFDRGASRQHLRDAGIWIAENIPASAQLYSNDLQLAYYTQHYGQQLYQAMSVNRNLDAVLKDKLKQYDYVALLINQKRDPRVASLMNEMRVPVIKDFVNRSGDHVTIYKMPPQAVQ